MCGLRCREAALGFEVACYKPVKAFQPLAGGAVRFTEGKDTRTVTLRCGQCIGCRVDRQKMWAIRCWAESKCHQANAFVTLTYSPEHYPMHGSLNYTHFQLFMKRLRKAVEKRGGGPFRFFMCGEYGDELARPHYHALLFGLDFPDKRKCNSVRSKRDVFQSEELDRVWGKGFATIGEVTYASARYVAAYTLKRHSVLGPDDMHYRRVDTVTGELVELQPEFARMSLKPGIGLAWLERYWRDLYETAQKAVIVNGKRETIPRYFDVKMRERMPAFMESFDWEREKEALKNWENNTPERLAVRNFLHEERAKFNREASI